MKKIGSFFGRLIAKALFNAKAVILLLVIAIAAGGAAYYFYNQNQKTLKLLNNPAQASEEEVTELTSKISSLMELPQGEKPTVITVVEKDKLKDQPFFSKAENGDKVLVFTQAKKAIMYRPGTNKIVEVGPVDITPNQTFKAAIYSGGDDTKVADAEKVLKDKVTNLEVTTGTTAAKTYTKTLVVDLKGDKTEETKQIADLVGGEVGTLPATETKPADADFLIITGK